MSQYPDVAPISGMQQVSDPQRRNTRMATAGIVVTLIALVVGCVSLIVFVVSSATAKARQAAMAIRDISAIQMTGNEIQIYIHDHFDELPPPGNWVKALNSSKRAQSVSTASLAGGHTIAMNSRLGGKKFTDVRAPGRTVLLFEVKPGSPLSGTGDLMPDTPHSPQGFLILFFDGHMENVPRDELGRLVWEP